MRTPSRVLHITKLFQINPPGSDCAGQSGVDQKLPEEAEADSESVTELVQEGQFLEENAVDAIENTRESDVVGSRTR